MSSTCNILGGKCDFSISFTSYNTDWFLESCGQCSDQYPKVPVVTTALDRCYDRYATCQQDHRVCYVWTSHWYREAEEIAEKPGMLFSQWAEIIHMLSVNCNMILKRSICFSWLQKNRLVQCMYTYTGNKITRRLFSFSLFIVPWWLFMLYTLHSNVMCFFVNPK